MSSSEYALCYKDQDHGETGRQFGSGFSRIVFFLVVSDEFETVVWHISFLVWDRGIVMGI